MTCLCDGSTSASLRRRTAVPARRPRAPRRDRSGGRPASRRPVRARLEGRRGPARPGYPSALAFQARLASARRAGRGATSGPPGRRGPEPLVDSLAVRTQDRGDGRGVRRGDLGAHRRVAAREAVVSRQPVAARRGQRPVSCWNRASARDGLRERDGGEQRHVADRGDETIVDVGRSSTRTAPQARGDLANGRAARPPSACSSLVLRARARRFSSGSLDSPTFRACPGLSRAVRACLDFF